MVLVCVYYLGLAPYEKSRHFLGLSEKSWVNWTKEIRRRRQRIATLRYCSRREDILFRLLSS